MDNHTESHMDKHIDFKNGTKKLFAMALAIFLSVAVNAAAQEAPDALVKRVSQEVLDIAKTDKDIQAGDRKRVVEVVDTKIFPHVDFQRTTAMTAGRFWRQATPEQQQRLANEFRRLIVNTYAGAISKARDQKIQFKPFRASSSDTDVLVRSELMQKSREPIELSYRLEKTPSGWKIYDMNILGAWLIETYKQTFANEINRSGIDGLIKTLAEKNDRLARAPASEKSKESK